MKPRLLWIHSYLRVWYRYLFSIYYMIGKETTLVLLESLNFIHQLVYFCSCRITKMAKRTLAQNQASIQNRNDQNLLTKSFEMNWTGLQKKQNVIETVEAWEDIFSSGSMLLPIFRERLGRKSLQNLTNDLATIKKTQQRLSRLVRIKSQYCWLNSDWADWVKS